MRIRVHVHARAPGVVCPPPLRFGPQRSADPSTFFGVYLLYLTQPAVVVARFWHDSPFTRAGLSPRWNSALVYATAINLTLFASYVLRWMVLYRPEYFPTVAQAWLTGAASKLELPWIQ